MADAFNVDSREFVQFYKQISKVDVETKKALRKRMMQAAKPVVEEVKQAELSIPATGGDAQGGRKKKGESLGLRQALAKATKADFNGTRVGAVVHIRVSTTKFVEASGGKYRSLPYYMEGRRKREWRHPVFGNTDVWVGQKPHPFLAPTILKHKAAFQKEVDAAIMDAIAKTTHI
jgi:hypothetical protein